MGQLQGRWSGTAGQEGRGLGAQGQEEKRRGRSPAAAEPETAPSILLSRAPLFSLASPSLVEAA